MYVQGVVPARMASSEQYKIAVKTDLTIIYLGVEV